MSSVKASSQIRKLNAPKRVKNLNVTKYVFPLYRTGLFGGHRYASGALGDQRGLYSEC